MPGKPNTGTDPVRAAVDEGKKTILLYSPDLNFCFSLSVLFQDRFNVITTTNLGLMDRLQGTYDADLVMIDAVPSEGLLGRLERLKQERPTLPVVILYVYSGRDAQLDRDIRRQVDSVFYKPIELETLTQRIESLLKGN
jgi:DNA-binding NarL/FixJ family response regulator